MVNTALTLYLLTILISINNHTSPTPTLKYVHLIFTNLPPVHTVPENKKVT